MRNWTYVGDSAELRSSAQDVLRCWDEMADIKTWGLVISRLRSAVQGERRMSWNDDAGYGKTEQHD